MNINGIFETHVHVRNLERSRAFYEDLLGLELGHLEQDRRVAFYFVGGRNHAMLGVWEKPEDQVIRQHYAFQSTVDSILNHSVDFLKERGLEPRNFLNDGTQNPMVFGWMPALAIYFEDPDGHSIEFIAPLDDPPRPEAGVVSWEDWQKLNQT